MPSWALADLEAATHRVHGPSPPEEEPQSSASLAPHPAVPASCTVLSRALELGGRHPEAAPEAGGLESWAGRDTSKSPFSPLEGSTQAK